MFSDDIVLRNELDYRALCSERVLWTELQELSLTSLYSTKVIDICASTCSYLQLHEYSDAWRSRRNHIIVVRRPGHRGRRLAALQSEIIFTLNMRSSADRTDKMSR